MTKFWSALLFAVSVSVFANVGLKLGMRNVDLQSGRAALWSLITNSWLWTGVI